ncbi:MAG: acyl-CoA thioesterase, partial [Caulobacteraceae bacterium]
MAEAENLIETLALERIEVNLFRGLAPRDDGPRIFGGLVIAQALLAAYGTVEDRLCHSIHCYFLRPGDPSVPILYEVDRARDGRSFTSRRVTAIQHGEQILNLAASFQVPENGLEHQDPMPDVPMPE